MVYKMQRKLKIPAWFTIYKQYGGQCIGLKEMTYADDICSDYKPI